MLPRATLRRQYPATRFVRDMIIHRDRSIHVAIYNNYMPSCILPLRPKHSGLISVGNACFAKSIFDCFVRIQLRSQFQFQVIKTIDFYSDLLTIVASIFSQNAGLRLLILSDVLLCINNPNIST